MSRKNRSTRGVNAPLLEYVHSFQLRFNNKKLWKSTGQDCKESWKYCQTRDFVAEAILKCYDSKAKQCGSSIPNVNSWNRTWILEIPKISHHDQNKSK